MVKRKFIPCAACGSTFKQQVDARKYCSRACYSTAKSPSPKTCKGCGKSFVKAANHPAAKFCSNDCMVESRRVKPHTCVTCGTLFSPVKFKKSEGRFVGATGRHNCSKQCHDAWKAKTKSAYMRANVEKFSGPNSWNWKGACLLRNKSYRGAEWNVVAESIRARDRHKCKHCGMTQEEHRAKWSQALEVHHIVPFHEFTNYQKANRPSNLVALCKSCHMTADRAIKTRQMLMIFEDEPRKKVKDGVSRGSRNARALLKEDQVKEIKQRLRAGHRQPEIAASFGVKKHVISAISTGQNWGHVS